MFAASFAGAVTPRQSRRASAIAPLHGPVVRSARNELVREYREWVNAQVKGGRLFRSR